MNIRHITLARTGLIASGVLLLSACGNKGALSLPPATGTPTAKTSPAQPVQPNDNSSAPAAKDQ